MPEEFWEEVEKMIYSGTINNSMLSGAIEMMRVDPSEKNHNLVLGEILKARFLCPVLLSKAPLIDKDGNPVLQDGCEVQYQMLQNASGEPYMIAFTNQQQFENWQKRRTVSTDSCYEFIMEFSEYIDIIIRPLLNGGKTQVMGVVIDPFGCNLKVDRDMIANLVIRRMQMADYETSLQAEKERLEAENPQNAEEAQN